MRRQHGRSDHCADLDACEQQPDRFTNPDTEPPADHRHADPAADHRRADQGSHHEPNRKPDSAADEGSGGSKPDRVANPDPELNANKLASIQHPDYGADYQRTVCRADHHKADPRPHAGTDQVADRAA